jgi:hydroxymethylglutaryl-CoA reductase (NADPH)
MAFIPNTILRKLYTHSSLKNHNGGVRFAVKNRLAPAKLLNINQVQINGQLVPEGRINVAWDNANPVPLQQINPDQPVDFPLGTLLTFHLELEPLNEGRHDIDVAIDIEPFGPLNISVTDSLRSGEPDPGMIPRDRGNDYSDEIIKARQDFIRQHTGITLDHVSRFSINPDVTRGNIEHFTGAIQVPMGIAGPLLVNGEHAQGEFYVPLATSEGTLVASYNRGMKVLHESGGVKCSVVGDNMQRAPVFVFEDASQARRFADWIVEKTDDIRAASEATDPFIRLKSVDYYLTNKFACLRFNFTTGDAAGMNMVGKATFAACNWILQNCDVVETPRFYLESNFATDKKASMINMMRTRGKRVTAEAVIKREALLNIMDADTESLYYHSKVANVGSMLSGANNNGCHSANAITAIFLATGQDVANVAESSAAIAYLELTPEKDLYMSITLPALIVATCGGGTGLPTQRESLETMGCYGVGKVGKFAEIVAGTVLAGEISLAAAISSLDWVSSHDQFGRNDPGKSS